jgi:hypothetical protein
MVPTVTFAFFLHNLPMPSLVELVHIWSIPQVGEVDSPRYGDAVEQCLLYDGLNMTDPDGQYAWSTDLTHPVDAGA